MINARRVSLFFFARGGRERKDICVVMYIIHSVGEQLTAGAALGAVCGHVFAALVSAF